MSARLLLLLLLLGAPLSARASSPYLPDNELWLSTGPLLSVGRRGGETGLGLGLEATLNNVDDASALGVFGQAQWMTDGYARLCGGVQATLVFAGLELGVMHETGTREHLPTTGVHLAPFVGFIYGSVALRVGIPLSDKGGMTAEGTPGRTRRGGEVGLVLTAKFPFNVDGSSTYVPSFPWE